MNEKDKLVPQPPGWGDDSLSHFLECAMKNRYATFHIKKDWYKRLADIDECFMRIADDWTNPPNLITPFLLLRSHAAFRAACEHALAGQVAEIFPELRAALEYAAYALHIAKNPKLTEVWLNRHQDDASLKAVKAEFLISNIRKTIQNANAETASIFDLLYQRTIDFGAHPNERAVTGNMKLIEDGKDQKKFLQIYLHGDGIELAYGMKSTTEVGICILDVMIEAFGDRFDAPGLRPVILELRKGL